jgi:hypothetical protein
MIGDDVLHFQQKNIRSRADLRFHKDYLEYVFTDGDGDKRGFRVCTQ